MTQTVARPPAPHPTGATEFSDGEMLADSNRRIGLISLAVGAATGLVLGLWSFDGPVPVPAWLGDYDDTSRRLARLGHIAFFGLGFTNLLLAREHPRLSLSPRALWWSSRTMNFGNIFLPLTLCGAAVWAPIKYTMSLPATSIFVALLIAAIGVGGGSHEPR